MRWLLAFVLIVPNAAWAGGFAVGEQSVRTAGAASTGVAGVDDASTAWFNPAAQLEDGWHLSVGVSALRPALLAESSSFSTATRAGLKTPPHVYATYQVHRFSTGLSLNVPFGSSVAWPDSWDGRYEAVDSSIQVFRAAPFAGYDLGRVRIAAGPHMDWMRVGSARKIDFVDVEGDVALGLSGVGFGGHAAVQYELNQEWTLGATYKSRTRVNLSGDADFTVPDEFLLNAPDQTATSTMTLPDQLALGAQWRRGRVSARTDLGITTWDVYDELRVDFANVNTSDLVRPTNWKTRPWIRGGAEYEISRVWALRAGAFYDPTPAPRSTLVPSSPDANRLGVTAGASYALTETLTLDAYAEVVKLLRRQSANPNSLDASYGGTLYIAGAGIRWH